MAVLDILLPTCNRLPSLIMTLSGVAAQTLSGLHLIIADQSREPAGDAPVVKSLVRIIEARGNTVEWHRRVPSKGIAEQRDFLLGCATSDAVLYLDDDVFMEPWVAQQMLETLQAERCGFVGAFPSGLSFRDDVRPQQQHIEWWEGPVRPEAVNPDSPAWERRHLHRAANPYHVARTLPPGRSAATRSPGWHAAYYTTAPSSWPWAAFLSGSGCRATTRARRSWSRIC